MAFTTWAALRTAIKDAIANHVAGSPCTGEYSIGNRRLKYRSFEELIDLYKQTFDLEALDTLDSGSSTTSGGSTWNKVKFARPV